MMKAPAPMTGGMSCPPVEAVASTAPANSGRHPTFFMSGIVKVPVVATFATDDPLIVPSSPDATTATFAGPPGLLPASESARSLKKRAPPLAPRKAPKRMKRKT